MKKLETICIRCPIGCHLVVTEQNGEVVVTGNRCPRGAEYGKQEFTRPMRTVTTIYKMSNGDTLSVRTKGDIEKSKYWDVIKTIKSAPEPKNPQFGDVLVHNILDSGVDVIITSVNKN